MRVFADCCVNGIKRRSTEYYRGDWDRCEEAAEAIRARIRGDISVLANLPGEIRIFWEDPGSNAYEVLADALLTVESLTDGLAELFSLDVENPATLWYPSLESSEPNQPGE